MVSLFIQDSEVLRHFVRFVRFVSGMFWGCKVVSDIRKGKWVSRKGRLVFNQKSHVIKKKLDFLVPCDIFKKSAEVSVCIPMQNKASLILKYFPVN